MTLWSNYSISLHCTRQESQQETQEKCNCGTFSLCTLTSGNELLTSREEGPGLLKSLSNLVIPQEARLDEPLKVSRVRRVRPEKAGLSV